MTGIGPVDHIARPPLPWRAEPDLTECGKPIAELNGRVVTRAEIEKRIRDIGKQRAAFTTCMTCATTSGRYHNDLLAPLAREIGTVQHAYPPRTTHFAGRTSVEEPDERWNRKKRLLAELDAITALIAAHRAEFDGYLAGLAETVSLTDRRRRRGGVR
jgi:hypothetical protein